MITFGRAGKSRFAVLEFERARGFVVSVGGFIKNFARNGDPARYSVAAGSFCGCHRFVFGINGHKTFIHGYFSGIGVS